MTMMWADERQDAFTKWQSAVRVSEPDGSWAATGRRIRLRYPSSLLRVCPCFLRTGTRRSRKPRSELSVVATVRHGVV